MNILSKKFFRKYLYYIQKNIYTRIRHLNQDKNVNKTQAKYHEALFDLDYNSNTHAHRLVHCWIRLPKGLMSGSDLIVLGLRQTTAQNVKQLNSAKQNNMLVNYIL